MKEEKIDEEVAEVATTEEVVEPTTKDVEIDLCINGIEYKGTVSISLDDCHDINLHNILDDYDRYAKYNGTIVCKVCHILAGEALYLAGEGFDDDIVECCETGWHADCDFMQPLENGDYCFQNLAYYFEEWGQWFAQSECEEHEVRDEDGYKSYVTAPRSYFDDMYYCEECGCYIKDSDDYYRDEDMCRWCYEDRHERVIEGYSESHYHNDDPIYYGDYKGTFVGMGFELEVDCDSRQSAYNNEVAGNLCEICELDSHEVRFAEDGSLNYGFECISEPHTVKDFWEKQNKWRKMLSYLADEGYRSHDPGTCGLHVHVSREMFGSTKEQQDNAIAKVYAFFDENWTDIVKVSRRRSFDYCGKNQLYYDYYDNIKEKKTTLYKCWKKKSKTEGSHGVALNNRNTHTFEYRLGRGTLNAWSFFSWIDFVLTITKNARRITVNKVETNDIISWLGGISESTAKYIYKRGAFKKEMLALYPHIEWENDLIDTN